MTTIQATARLPKAAQAVAGAASKDPGRFALNAVRIRFTTEGDGPGAVQVTATDGRRLVQVEYNGEASATGNGETVLEGPAFAKALRGTKAMKGGRPGRVMVQLLDNGTLEFIGPDGGLRGVSPATGRFPKVSDVIPAADLASAGGTVGFSGSVLPGALEAVSRAVGPAAGWTGANGARLRVRPAKDAKSPWRIDAEGEYGTGVAVVMPLVLD